MTKTFVDLEGVRRPLSYEPRIYPRSNPPAEASPIRDDLVKFVARAQREWWDEQCRLNGRMHDACACTGPQPGARVCPCRMRAIERDVDVIIGALRSANLLKE